MPAMKSYKINYSPHLIETTGGSADQGRARVSRGEVVKEHRQTKEGEEQSKKPEKTRKKS